MPQKTQRDHTVRALFASVLVFVAAVWLYAQVDWAIQAWDKHAPKPSEMTRFQGEEMTGRTLLNGTSSPRCTRPR